MTAAKQGTPIHGNTILKCELANRYVTIHYGDGTHEYRAASNLEEHLLTALRARREGYVEVPREPTGEMMRAALRVSGATCFGIASMEAYKAMLLAAEGEEG